MSSLTKPMIMIILSLSFKILGDLRISADLSGSIPPQCPEKNLKTIVGDTLVDDSLVYEKGRNL